MNLQQLEYVVAVDTHRHFTTAAARCFVTQATLSMMIRKLEHELDVVIFDRSKQPVKPTEIGAIVIAQARRILAEASNIRTLIEEHRGTVAGDLHIGIIPTLAPYLLPRFIRRFTASYPQIRLKISEMLTDDIVRKLRIGQLDGGLLATPLNEKDIREIPLFYESFLLYANTNEQVMKKKYVLPADLDVRKLLLLEEGHCMRNQLLNFCELKRAHDSVAGFDYEAGSIETLVRMVDHHQGITIIPELAALEMEKRKQNRLRRFKGPAPVREISLVYQSEFQKRRLLELLQQSISEALPPELKRNRGEVLEIE